LLQKILPGQVLILVSRHSHITKSHLVYAQFPRRSQNVTWYTHRSWYTHLTHADHKMSLGIRTIRGTRIAHADHKMSRGILTCCGIRTLPMQNDHKMSRGIRAQPSNQPIKISGENRCNKLIVYSNILY
jgi:hypothetical protein